MSKNEAPFVKYVRKKRIKEKELRSKRLRRQIDKIIGNRANFNQRIGKSPNIYV